MRVVIRTDASIQIGSGHVMRCLTLADQLRTKGAEVTFICRDHPGHMNDIIEKRGFVVHRLPLVDADRSNALESEYARWLAVPVEIDAFETCAWLKDQNPVIDLLVVDHYGLASEWERAARPFVSRIMVIDDLANRKHDCDLLLDQNYWERSSTRYDGLVPVDCQLLLGPKYAMLRPEFIHARQQLRKRDGIVRRVFVFFGGCDPSNETAKTLEAIRIANLENIVFDIVVGDSNPHKESIEEQCQSLPNTKFHCQIGNMAELMAQADLAIGAGGTTTWERCCLGLPSIIIAVAANQVPIGQEAERLGIAAYLGTAGEVLSTDIAEKLLYLVAHPDLVRVMSEQSLSHVDGRGTNRVVASIPKAIQQRIVL